MILNNKKTFSVLSVLAVSALLVGGVFTASAEDQGKERDQAQAQAAQNKKTSELASSYDSRYWGTPKKDISTSADQDEYESSQAPIPGIEVSKSEVFSTYKVIQNATLAPLGSGNLINHGGQVLNEIHIYPIFWGPSSILTQTYKDAISNFFVAIQCGGSNPKCSGLGDVVQQYFNGLPTVIKYGNSFSDISNPPTSSPSTSTIVAEAANVVKATPGASLDPKGFYIVFTSNFPARANFCAWHSAGSYKATSTSIPAWYTVAYMPYVGTMTGCSAANLPGFSGSFKNGQSIHSVINVSTHELFETMSDSILNNRYAWYDAAGYENGDKCAWKFASTMNGYLVQSEYSNSPQGCPNLTS